MAFATLEGLQKLLHKPHANDLPDPAEVARQQNQEQLYGLLCYVQQELVRNEQLFDLAEDDALIDNIVYTIKSLRAQQQFLVQNLRRLEGVGAEAAAPAPAAAEAEPEATAASAEPNNAVPREGFALG